MLLFRHELVSTAIHPLLLTQFIWHSSTCRAVVGYWHMNVHWLRVQLMLWSQIKLTSYDFTYLHITGEFDNRPGTGRFLRIFSCVVTYCTGADRRLIWLHRPMPDRAPCGVVKEQPETVRCLTDFTRIFRCNGEFVYIKICHHFSKETG